MKMVQIVLTCAVALPLIAAKTNYQDNAFVDLVTRLAGAERSEAPLLLADKEEVIPVLIMEPLDSEAIRQLLPKKIVYRLIASKDIIHRATFSCLIIEENGRPTNLQTDQQVLDYIGGLSRNISTKSDALQLIRLFSELRSYQIINAPTKTHDARKSNERPTPTPLDYKFVAMEKGDWSVHATMLTDGYSHSHERLEFILYKSPGSGIEIKDRKLIFLGTYVR